MTTTESIQRKEGKLRAAVVIAHYGHKNEKHLDRVLSEWETMKTIAADITVLTAKDLPAGADPASLPFLARPILQNQLHANQYDLFAYSEDDMLITERNLKAWGELTAAYMERNEVAGFMRFEIAEPSGERRFPDMHGAFHWENLQNRHGQHFAQFTNQHQGCYVLTGWQLKLAIESGGFLVGLHATAPFYGGLESGASDVFTQCGLTRLICLSRFEELLVHHLPDSYLHLGRPEGVVRDELKAMGVEWK